EIAMMIPLTDQGENVAQLSDELASWIERQEIDETVTVILSILSDKEKVVFHDFIVDGLSPHEIEAKNSMTHDAVHGILARIRKKSRHIKKLLVQ
ncbi:MAG: hypothetical protein RSH26_10215, partial [Clostridia bacterium]